ncbi:hypothetical protein GE061_010969 [Apolygus lucorum]|uniref:Uncharacterized protein n=1 Tax=Apolygus lucorum TaxID=248454 RepID=A0A8S9XY75_APOLU|nr:hypothetical protein GE061_010969 [Apolygus lucorum]
MNSESDGWTIPDIISTTKERIARHQQETAPIQATDRNVRNKVGELYDIISALCNYLSEINERVIESNKKIIAIESENSVLREVATISRTEPSQPKSKTLKPRDEEDTDTADEDDLATDTQWIRVKNKRRKTYKSPPEKQGKVREKSPSRISPKEKKVYPPPPITISGIKEYPVLLGILKEATDKPCKVTALNSDQWKVNVSDGDIYRQV